MKTESTTATDRSNNQQGPRPGHGASYCSNCNSIWEFEPRDFFVGELYCPLCATRHIELEKRFDTLEEAVEAHPKASVYRN